MIRSFRIHSLLALAGICALSGRTADTQPSSAPPQTAAASQAVAPSEVAVSAQPAAPPSLWDGMVMMGASLSGGFTLSEPLGGPQTQRLKLSRHMDAALAVPHPPIRNVGSALFFMRPEQSGLRMAELAASPAPTLVFAVDFLFWYCYGAWPSDEARLAAFERGLKMLDGFSCPVVVGDIPDASAAVNTGIISADQVPSETIREACNKRLREWAAKKPNIILVPLANFMRAAMADEAIVIREQTWPKGTTRALLQPDRLHPNAAGVAIAALMVWDAVLTARPELYAGDFRWNTTEIARLAADAAAQAAVTTSNSTQMTITVAPATPASSGGPANAAPPAVTN